MIYQNLTHEWRSETVTNTFWGKEPHPAMNRMQELERDGWEIFTCQLIGATTEILLIYRRQT